MQNFIVFGYARTKMTDEELRNMISRTLTCRIDKRLYFTKNVMHTAIYFLFSMLYLLIGGNDLTGKIVKTKWFSS
jgi:hypothetical protein